MKIARVLAAAAAVCAATAFAADRLEVEGSTSAFYMLKPHAAALRDSRGVDIVVAPVGTARAMLDLLDGRTRVAIVTAPLSDAVEAARALAFSEEGRVVTIKGTLIYTTMPAMDATGRVLAFVTMGAPAAQVTRVVDYFSVETRRSTVAAAH
jgi:hypothetical protein